MDEEQRLQFGDRVYAMRVRLGLNRDDFAARYGLSRWAISAWEEGRYTPLAVAQSPRAIRGGAPHEFADSVKGRTLIKPNVERRLLSGHKGHEFCEFCEALKNRTVGDCWDRRCRLVTAGACLNFSGGLWRLGSVVPPLK
jgi:DNA-binding XRE family transcriptional regulator